MNGQYEKELKKIEFYKTHPEYLPFVGDKYDEFKILQVGESHYIGQNENYAPFGLEDFDKWWINRCDKVYNEPDEDPETQCWGSWYNTREVIGRFLKSNQKNYSIFMNMIRALNEVKELPACDDEKKKYHCFAFMNFFQMPSLYQGMSFEASLYKAAKETDDPAAVYKRAVAKSCAALDKVIEILQPNAVVFTSKAAYKAYCNHKGNIVQDNRIIETVHPCCSWWNRKIKRFGGNTGREHVVAELKKHWLNKQR